jgi:hypothetical protein
MLKLPELYIICTTKEYITNGPNDKMKTVVSLEDIMSLEQTRFHLNSTPSKHKEENQINDNDKVQYHGM